MCSSSRATCSSSVMHVRRQEPVQAEPVALLVGEGGVLVVQRVVPAASGRGRRPGGGSGVGGRGHVSQWVTTTVAEVWVTTCSEMLSRTSRSTASKAPRADDDRVEAALDGDPLDRPGRVAERLEQVHLEPVIGQQALRLAGARGRAPRRRPTAPPAGRSPPSGTTETTLSDARNASARSAAVSRARRAGSPPSYARRICSIAPLPLASRPDAGSARLSRTGSRRAARPARAVGTRNPVPVGSPGREDGGNRDPPRAVGEP